MFEKLERPSEESPLKGYGMNDVFLLVKDRPGLRAAQPFGFLLAVFLLFLPGRHFLFAMYYEEYPFIHNYGRMPVWFLLMTSICIISVIAAEAAGGYLYYRFQKRIKLKYFFAAAFPVLALVIVLLPKLSGGGVPRGTVESFTPEKRTPVRVIGIGGADWDVIEGYSDRLPFFSELRNRGAGGYLKSRCPSWSPLLWTTIPTGKIPEKHGIKGFIYYKFPLVESAVLQPDGMGMGAAPAKPGDMGRTEMFSINSRFPKVPGAYHISPRNGRSVLTAGDWPSWSLRRKKGIRVIDRAPGVFKNMPDERKNTDPDIWNELERNNYIYPAGKIAGAFKEESCIPESNDDFFFRVFEKYVKAGHDFVGNRPLRYIKDYALTEQAGPEKSRKDFENDLEEKLKAPGYL